MHINRAILGAFAGVAPLMLAPLRLAQVTLGQTGVGACFTEEPTLASDGTDRELFGSSVAVEGRLMVIGAEGWSGLSLKLQYDLYYIKNFSLLYDLSILFNTIKTVVLRKGT